MREQIARRRTFAIVSHPDAGKTTLTEKFLLYGGALHLAGSVTARKNQRSTTSDWMELEKKRGISISSTVLQFDYRGFRINLLDTPGHRDFSEDTYRVLTAVDAAVMVIDAGKGIESQTRKLFEVCRHRGVPIFTFMNKLDRPTLDPLALVDELESVLGIAAYPMNWPLGTGTDFRGVWDRRTRMVHLYERTPGGGHRAPVYVSDLSDPAVRGQMDDALYRTVREEVDMLEGAGASFRPEEVLAGRTTPVYFGSALNNFGVQLLLDGFLEHSAAPAPRGSRAGVIEPDHPAFSGFVFKIQANMDPRHRDRVAFVRVCSGKFEAGMDVTHVRTKKTMRLSAPQQFLARERSAVDEAWPGDVIG
ncbi:MAG TPA: peptide chain release factor 3, partial [Candidatus Krumholzibacteria bacterium]|nr:peptide chain release factor 3 [Candidatus Krumholzibacteria bacterium]